MADVPPDKPFYLGIIPARSGSKRMPDKNIRPLAGMPLIAHTIKAAAESKKIARTVVSTDSKRIAGIAREWGGDVPFLRPAEIAGDTSSPVEAILHAVNAIEAEGRHVDAIVLLQPTSPLRTASDIDAAIDLFESTGADTVTSVRLASEHPYWCWTVKDGALHPYFSRDLMSMGRESLPQAYVENGAVFVAKRSVVAGTSIYGDKVVPYIMSLESSVDIDMPDDLVMAESAIERKGARKGSRGSGRGV